MAQMMTTIEVAEQLQVSARTIRTLVDLGELRAYLVGRQLRFHPDDLRAYLERARVQEAS